MKRLLTHALAIAALLGWGVGAVAQEYPGYREYCLRSQRAERMVCRAEGTLRRAACIDDFAFNQWLLVPGDGSSPDPTEVALGYAAAANEYNLCLDDAKAYVTECLATEITNCD